MFIWQYCLWGKMCLVVLEIFCCYHFFFSFVQAKIIQKEKNSIEKTALSERHVGMSVMVHFKLMIDGRGPDLWWRSPSLNRQSWNIQKHWNRHGQKANNQCSSVAFVSVPTFKFLLSPVILTLLTDRMLPEYKNKESPSFWR